MRIHVLLAIPFGLVAATRPLRPLSAQQPVTFQSISAGHNHTCAVATDGQAFCWGSNRYGELGAGATATAERCDSVSGSNYPCSTVPLRVAGDLTFQSVSAGEDFSCALTTSGAAYCWGSAGDGQLGVSVTERCRVGRLLTYRCSTTPVAVAGGLTFMWVGPGCGIATDSLTYCWFTRADRSLPSQVPEPLSRPLAFRQMSIGGGHLCAVTHDGAAYCWGDNRYGQLGNATSDTRDHEAPVRVAGARRFEAVSAGIDYSCALTATGVAYCWGAEVGQQRCRFFTPEVRQTTVRRCSTTPIAVSNRVTFTSLSAGETYACGITAGGAAYCWGENVALGWNADSTPRRSGPRAAPGELVFRSVSAGLAHACGLTVDGAVYCWGSNRVGQLGDGSTRDHETPQRVASPR